MPGIDGKVAEASGYRVLDRARVPGLGCEYIELVHERTGARHVHIVSPDRECTFAAAFLTVPQDSTGVAHILEHTALCGSQRYPVRDPFFSMLRRSTASFMNAFTSSDWTMYPFSTANGKDFDNLLSVYLDAAFFPLLSELSFLQEGVRLEKSEGGAELVYKGVVLNEMKGALSSPSQIMGRSLLKHLFPDVTYHVNSGGDPAEIVTLTHADLVAFHRRHYHPSNAFFYTYGNLDLPRVLEKIERSVLDRFPERLAPLSVPRQPRFSAPRRADEPYPVSPEEDLSKKSQASVGFLLSDATDAFSVMAGTLAEKILLGHSASPLRKALIDSRLGSDLADATGFDSDMRETIFACGLKETSRSDSGKVEDLVLSTLAGLSRRGIEKDLVRAAIHQYELSRREITNEPFAFGLKLFFAFCGPWFHGGKIGPAINFEEDLARIRDLSEKGGFFEDLLLQGFTENPHRVTLTLYPDPDMSSRLAAGEEGRLARIREGMAPEDLAEVDKNARSLALLQETPEDVSVLPILKLSDIPPEVERMAPSQVRAEGRVARYEAATNGLFYLTLASEPGGIPRKHEGLVPFFCYCFARCGTKDKSYEELSRSLAAHTGGISLSASANRLFTPAGDETSFLLLDAKCVSRNIGPALDLVRELVLSCDFRNPDRLRTLVAEYSARLTSSVVANGHRYALSLAARGFSRTRALSEQWAGISQVRLARALAGDLSDEAMARLSADLQEIARSAFAGPWTRICVVGEEGDNARGADFAEGLLSRLPAVPAEAPASESALPRELREGYYLSSAVSFCAYCRQTAALGHQDAPLLAVAARVMKNAFLHREVREKGGAYGAFALHSSEDGVFSLASFRDPQVAQTLSAFSRALSFAAEGRFTDQDVYEAILSVCAELDRPHTPQTAARKAFFRNLTALSDQARREFKEGVLASGREAVAAACRRHLSSCGTLAPVTVISGREQLEKANREMPEAPLALFAVES
ncbi:MAG: insulinase family protein [Thermodesulfobacteriota bacterium]